MRRQRPGAEGALLPQVPRVRRLLSMAGLAQVLHVHGRAGERRAPATAARPDFCVLQVTCFCDKLTSLKCQTMADEFLGLHSARPRQKPTQSLAL